jgi:hypothetical protein
MKESKQAISSARASSPRAAAVHAGHEGAIDTPRQHNQGTRISQLQAVAAPVVQRVEVEGARKTKGFNRGKSHSSTTPSGKTTSHKPGKGREENPRKSAAKNRRRDRMLAANVANSQNK